MLQKTYVLDNDDIRRLTRKTDSNKVEVKKSIFNCCSTETRDLDSDSNIWLKDPKTQKPLPKYKKYQSP